MRESYKAKSPLAVKYAYIPEDNGERRIEEVFDFLFQRIKQEYLKENSEQTSTHIDNISDTCLYYTHE